jgi:hypothetical protein
MDGAERNWAGFAAPRDMLVGPNEVEIARTLDAVGFTATVPRETRRIASTRRSRAT